MKFVLFTIFGGAFLLVAIIGIYVSIGTLQMVAIPTETGQIISGIPERIAGAGLIAPAAMVFRILPDRICGETAAMAPA